MITIFLGYVVTSSFGHTSYLSFFSQAKFLENKIYTEIYTVIANLHSKLPIFALNLKKFTPAKINLHGRRLWRL